MIELIAFEKPSAKTENNLQFRGGENNSRVDETMRRAWNTLAKILVAGAFIAWLLAFTGIENIAQSFIQMGAGTFLAAGVMAVIVALLNGAALWALYRVFSNIGFLEFLPAFLSSWVMGYIVPGKVGGLSLGVFLKDKVAPGQSAAIFIADKAITVILAFAVAMLVLPAILTDQELLFTIAAVIVILVGAFLLFYTQAGRGLIKNILGGHSVFFEGYSKAFPALLEKPAGILWNCFFTIARFFLQGVILVLFFFAIGVDAGITQATLLVAAGAIASLAPFTFSGLGVKESVFVLLSVRMGFPAPESAAVALASTIVSWGILALFSGYFWGSVKNAAPHAPQN
ncbi:MAG: flippase-like domain-containing protein [archaeon]|nr:flippase-like domain-containing protein [archaeon]